MPLYSFAFMVFLPVVFVLYWFVFNRSALTQNILLVAASLFFYSWVDWRLTGLLLFSVAFNFGAGWVIDRLRTGAGCYFLYLGVAVNLALLVYFKYFHFFYESGALAVILPLGISFFTLQAIGYLVDIYREEIRPANLLSFTLYLTWFPKITAGPVERAAHFLPQAETRRVFKYDQAVDGLRQILWGAFTKLVIANNCASLAQPIFEHTNQSSGSTLLAGAFFYTFQLYGDFAGYSNIAIGISKLFGIRLMRNFSAPFFSTNIREFWKKWHISLSSWMMHYVFYPLSFTLRAYRKTGLFISILVTFVLIGCWHGPNWTFLLFGLLHGLYFIPLIIAGTVNRSDSERSSLSFSLAGRMLALFLLVMLTLIVFGAGSVTQAGQYFARLFSSSLFSIPVWPVDNGWTKFTLSLLSISTLLTVEWRQRGREHELQLEGVARRPLRWGIYYTLLLLIILFGSVVHIDFMYSKF